MIGSGATAVTLVPALAERAAQVTMLQRSPSYVINLPQCDALSNALRRVLPEKWVYRLARGRNVTLQLVFYTLAKRFPNLVRRILLGLVRRQLGEQVDLRHFSPRYKPWDQRVCAVPDGDLFRVLLQGKAQVVTAEIECFTAHGIRLKSGEELTADVIVSATGLQLQLFGGIEVQVDGVPFQASLSMGYRGIMLRDLPNLAVVMGYTNASWTLKADLSSEYFCRLIRHLDAIGMRQVTRVIAQATSALSLFSTCSQVISSGPCTCCQPRVTACRGSCIRTTCSTWCSCATASWRMTIWCSLRLGASRTWRWCSLERSNAMAKFLHGKASTRRLLFWHSATTLSPIASRMNNQVPGT